MKKRITTVILSMVLVAAIILESTPVAYAASGEYLDPTEPETEEYEVYGFESHDEMMSVYRNE